MKIMILGAGSFGCALANVVSDNGHDVILWGHLQKEIDYLAKTKENPFVPGAKLNDDISFTSDLTKVNDVDMVVYVIPSFALRETSKKINSILKKPQNFVICTKGIEAESMKSGYEIVKEEVEKVKDIAILSGPTHAEELAFRKLTTIVATSENMEYAKEVQNIFNNNYLRVYTNTDVNGVEILGAAKNVLAIAAGVCDSHPNLGDNAKAALLTRGLRELKIIGLASDADSDTFYGLTGLGDLIVTATSKHSRNRKFGELLGKGLSREEAEEEVGMVVEGIYSVDALHKLKESTNLDLPIIVATYQFIYGGRNLDDILVDMFSREVKSEL